MDANKQINNIFIRDNIFLFVVQCNRWEEKIEIDLKRKKGFEVMHWIKLVQGRD